MARPPCLLSPRDCSEQASAQSEGGRLGSGLQLVRCDSSDPHRGHSSSHSPGQQAVSGGSTPGSRRKHSRGSSVPFWGAGRGTQTQLFPGKVAFRLSCITFGFSSKGNGERKRTEWRGRLKTNQDLIGEWSADTRGEGDSWGTPAPPSHQGCLQTSQA